MKGNGATGPSMRIVQPTAPEMAIVAVDKLEAHALLVARTDLVAITMLANFVFYRNLH